MCEDFAVRGWEGVELLDVLHRRLQWEPYVGVSEILLNDEKETHGSEMNGRR